MVRAESLKASLESGAGSSPGERRNLKGVAVGRKEKGDEREARLTGGDPFASFGNIGAAVNSYENIF